MGMGAVEDNPCGIELLRMDNDLFSAHHVSLAISLLGLGMEESRMPGRWAWDDENGVM